MELVKETPDLASETIPQFFFMQLRPCPACSHNVSPDAYVCPSCGHPLQAQRCEACGHALALKGTTAHKNSSSPRFGEHLAPVSTLEYRKRASIFRIAIEEAKNDRGTLRDPRNRLRQKWAELREQLAAQVSPQALAEYKTYSNVEREARHARQAWVHQEARLLHANLNQLSTRASEAGAVVDAWFADPDFDVQVRAFMDNLVPAEDLLAAARRWQKSRR
ncbi:MAG: zinc ribbon domain-containing protein [Gemmatimonadaceae bacterium]|nr:zinc ribbon domain-containing protein [Gemmatimonadaceae bacterium]